MRIVRTVISILFAFSLYCCVPEPIMLHGDINGNVRDADLKQPLDSAIVTLKQSQTTQDIDTTDLTGAFQFRNLSPGYYEIIASKHLFKTEEEIISVEPANITEINLSLNGAPYPEFSQTWVDFGFESTEGSFIVSNIGRGALIYSLASSQEWINVEPKAGTISTEADTITVTIDRSNLGDNKYKEEIYFNYNTSEGPVQDTVYIVFNGVVDRDGNIYNVVTIGTQTWMQDNLNTGVQIIYPTEQSDNTIIEKWCYDDDASNCDTYGGQYSWAEFMDYSPADTGIIGTTQGICPDGWHIPSLKELEVLVEYLGGWEVAGGRMKADSPLWEGEPNPGAKDSGFDALPAGYHIYSEYTSIGNNVAFWLSDYSTYFGMIYYGEFLDLGTEGHANWKSTNSVRCVKDPE